MMPRPISLAYLIEPRFPGGTSQAFARELRIAAGRFDVSVHAIDSAMLRGHPTNPAVEAALTETGLPLRRNSAVVAADMVVLHNPALLKHDTRLAMRIFADHLVVVSHENFLRPGGEPAFDVAGCLRRIERNALVLRRSIAPVSDHNRATVADWMQRSGLADWAILDKTWFNVVDMDVQPPAVAPRDRRGRHSRPGFEKFPALAVLDRCFPPSAESNVILGADTLLDEGRERPHWTLYPFRAIPVPQYFEMIDFMVYFTAATWRESFGRVLAEAIGAGKVVISDSATASAFRGGVIAARPDEVDAVIRAHVESPALYRTQVAAAQRAMAEFGADAFAAMIEEVARGSRRVAA
jgi:hypothetical protein